MVSMNAENIDIGYVYNNLIMKVRRDFDVIRMSVILDVFWEIVFILQSMVTIGFGLDEFEITNEDNRYKTFRTITNKLKKLLLLIFCSTPQKLPSPVLLKMGRENSAAAFRISKYGPLKRRFYIHSKR